MDLGIYIVTALVIGIASFYVTRFLFKKLLGEVLYAVGKNGKRYRVLKQPSESLSNAIGRLKEKVKADASPAMK